MEKLLYITDQGEYVDHGFILPLFEKYLKSYFEIDIVYFTEFKSDFERKDKHRFIVPSRYKKSLLQELSSNDIDINGYSFVIVRNDMAILKHVLKEKENYRYKTGFRLSFPKRRAKLKLDIAKQKASFLDKLANKFRQSSEVKVINACDIFIPTSKSMHEEFFPGISINTFYCPAGMDPDNLHENLQHTGDEKRFIYAGTIDPLREFEILLDGFSLVKSSNWLLTISTPDSEYLEDILENYPQIKENIAIQTAKDDDELLHLIALADVGVAVVPHRPVFNTSLPVKTIKYYSSAVPTLMTNTAHANDLFLDNIEAWFCEYTAESISHKIEYIISLSKEEVALVGQKGQDKLLETNNYETIALELSKSLQHLS